MRMLELSITTKNSHSFFPKTQKKPHGSRDETHDEQRTMRSLLSKTGEYVQFHSMKKKQTQTDSRKAAGRGPTEEMSGEKRDKGRSSFYNKKAPWMNNEATKIYKMAITSIALGTPREASQPDAVKAAVAEFFSVFIFIFAGQGSAMAVTSRLGQEGATTPAGLLLVALAHAFALFVAVSVSANTSGGHVNPAVTFAAFLGGSITLLRAIVYVVAQLLGSLSACLLLTYATGGQQVVAFGLGAGVSAWSAVVLEVVMTFGLVYTVHATTVDPKKGDVSIVAPIAIGFIVGANILAGGAFDGASMNPAGSFGPAVVGWSWSNHWVYWVGPLIGAATATTIYHTIFIGDLDHEPLPTVASEDF